ncbi:SAV_2336 N-terminal domain-related protein [Micromonospora inyonensis]|uniref:NACHT domain-containing protein n=1 Tax=Micromonospora inyonensis TaxID=47866 RepID=A0A1C6S8M0_9ACTN|nr:SAV_2336 N-terminal domain-related protein [Micromonospora inyonensis]SCL25845.1 NACHT domain-containing protein [Micromonospora inyonensis]
MTARIDRLLAVLDAAGVRLTPAELAEAIWLALRVDVAGRVSTPAGSGSTGPSPGESVPGPADPVPGPASSRPSGPGQVELRLPVPAGETPPDAADRVAGRPGEPADPVTGGPEPLVPGTAPDTDPVGGADDGGLSLATVPGWPLSVPTASALPDSGQVLRALRPLKRRIRSGHRATIDEVATACQIAERRLWTPVWRPATDRWLHLTLVLDRSSVGGIWARLGHEVRTLLERLGAFRTIRVAYLGLRQDGTIGVTARARPGGSGPATAPRSPLGLADLTGDHLLLVLSDCVSRPWHDGEMSRVLGHWARRAPVAILQPLPDRLWSRTGLDPVPGRLSAPRAGAPGTAYGFTSAWRRRGLPERSGPVPVLEIEPRWLRSWANLVAGRAVGGIDTIVTPAGVAVARQPVVTVDPDGSADPSVDPSPEQRVRTFRAGASVPAYQLARYLSAAVPLNLAVIRVVQAVMVPRARPSHLAEVLYGGLLAPVSPGGGADDEQHLEFLPGVRQVLLGTLHRAEAGRVLADVSRYLERHLERTGASFTAVVSAPVGGLTVPALRQPFAQIRAEVLRRLAGRAGPPGDTEPAGGPGESAGPAWRSGPAAGRLTILHLTGWEPGGADDPGPASGRFDPALLDDLVATCRRDRMVPHLVVVTAAVTRRATPAEYQAAYRMLEDLRTRLDLPTGRTVVVPGLSDVNEGRCLAHFLDRAADGAEPVPPYWPKWEPFAELTARLPGATAFQPHQPWQLLPVPAARTVVAVLNSTMSVSHLPGERFGRLGHAQLRWFADRLRAYERRGWLRVGVLHHDPTGEAGDPGLRDADDLTRLLAPHLDVVLHGHRGGVRELGLTGVPAVGAHRADDPTAPDTDRTGEAGGYRYQLVDLRPGTLRVLPRGHGAGPAPTAGEVVSHAYGDHWWPPDAEGSGSGATGGADALTDGTRTDLLARVARIYRTRTPDATMAEHRWPGTRRGGPFAGYLVVSPGGEHFSAPYRIGVYDGEPRAETVRRFLDDVVRPAGPHRDATLVCRSAPADPGLRERALGQGVRLVSFADFELGDDVLRSAERWAASLDADPAFPAVHYVAQPYVLFDPGTGSSGTPDGAPVPPAPDLLGRLRRWLAAPEGQVIAVLGASGTGKTFLLRELARRLYADHDPVVPILVDLRSLDWRVGLAELMAINLARSGVRRVDLDLNRYLLHEGRVVLLCDGLDDLATRTAHDKLGEWVAGWEAGARIWPGRSKVVLVSRDADLLADALGAYAAEDPAGAVVRWVRLVGLDRERMLEFLARRLGGPERARDRLELLGRVGGLPGMARNPRMLAFIADIDEQWLRSAASGGGRVTVADLYRWLISDWLDGERRRGGAHHIVLDDLERAATYLARRLWESGEPALGADALGAAADILTRLGTARGGGTPGRSATARLLGAGTLLVRDSAYRFHFVDQSVLEWLVAREIADQLDPDQPAGRVRGLLRRELTPLLVEFLCDLAGHDTARRWAEAANADPAAPLEVRSAAHRILDHLDRFDAGRPGPDQRGAGSPDPPAGGDRA